MLIQFAMEQVLFVVFKVLSLLGEVTELPLNTGPILLEAVTYVYAFTHVFWPLEPMLICLFWYIPFKVAMMFARFFLGARVPQAY